MTHGALSNTRIMISLTAGVSIEKEPLGAMSHPLACIIPNHNTASTDEPTGPPSMGPYWDPRRPSRLTTPRQPRNQPVPGHPHSGAVVIAQFKGAPISFGQPEPGVAEGIEIRR
ncbi:MAG: hypothetical protein ACP5HZ_05440 [Ferrimicrobium sp.]